MQFRADEETILRQVEKDTQEFIDRGLIKPDPLAIELDLREFCRNLSKFIESNTHMLPLGRECGFSEIEQAFSYAESKCDMLLLVGCALPRVVTHFTDSPVWYGDKNRVELSVVGDCLQLEMCRRLADSVWAIETIFKRVCKPSKLISQLYGEKFCTAFFQSYPVSKTKLKLHVTTHYIPELYMMLKENENLKSCMSKSSSCYDLPDSIHPTMAYENSSDVALALLFDEKKGRHVARAIARIDGGCLYINRAYGRSGADDLFEKLGVYNTSDMNGISLSRIECGGEIVAPYVDGTDQRFTDMEDYLLVDDDGDLEVDIDSGRIKKPEQYCPCCQEYHAVDDTEFRYTEDGDVCEHCYDEYYVEVDGDMMHRDSSDIVYIDSRDKYVRCDNAFYCDYNCEYYDAHRDCYYTVEVDGRYEYTVVSESIDDVINEWNVTGIDGEELIDWLVANRDYEPEQEEEAA